MTLADEPADASPDTPDDDASEASLDRAVAQAIELAASRHPRGGHTRIVAVDGPSGSGKTTLAQRVADTLSARGEPVQIVHLDDLYPGWGGLAEAVPRLAEWVVEPLAQGRDGAYRRYDWGREEYAEWHPVPGADWLVVEGVGCGARAVASHYALLWWVEAERAERMRRGLERDGETYAPHWQRWAEQEEAFFAREGTRDRADLITDTTTSPEGPDASDGTVSSDSTDSPDSTDRPGAPDPDRPSEPHGAQNGGMEPADLMASRHRDGA